NREDHFTALNLKGNLIASVDLQTFRQTIADRSVIIPYNPADGMREFLQPAIMGMPSVPQAIGLGKDNFHTFVCLRNLDERGCPGGIKFATNLAIFFDLDKTIMQSRIPPMRKLNRS